MMSTVMMMAIILLFIQARAAQTEEERVGLQILEDWIHTSDLIQAEKRFACTSVFSIMIEPSNYAGSLPCCKTASC